MSGFHNILVDGLTLMPEAVLWPFARRYVAGRSWGEAQSHLQRLIQQGFLTTVDVLGESETDPKRMDNAVQLYETVLDTLARKRLPGNISVKLSHFGLLSDPDDCYCRVRDLVALAIEHDQFVRLDMEDSQCTDATLAIYRRLRDNYANVGIVLQARLHRTPHDVDALMVEGIAHIRLCKGIYIEPASIAHTQPQAITQAFIRLIDRLMAGPTEKLAVASHDTEVIQYAQELLPTAKAPVEFQLLLGARPDLAQQLNQAALPVRIYVPFGHQWKAYCLRRFRENPQLLAYVIANLLPG